MKRLIFILLFLPFLSTGQTTISNNLAVSAPKALDARTGKFVSGAWVGWASRAEANATIQGTRRYVGLTICIDSVVDATSSCTEYWYQAGIADNNLVLKSVTGGGGTTYTAGTGLGLSGTAFYSDSSKNASVTRLRDTAAALRAVIAAIPAGGSSLDTTVIYLSKAGVPDDASLVDNSHVFGTDGYAAIQAVLNTGGGTRPLKVIWNTHTSISNVLRVKSNTTIEGLDGCGAIARINMNKWMLENYNVDTTNVLTTTAATADSNIHIKNLILNGNGYYDGATTWNQSRYNTNVQVMSIAGFVGVKHLSLEGVKMIRSAAYHLFIANATDILLRDCYIHAGSIDTSVQDAFHIAGRVSNLRAYNCYAHVHDGTFVLSADDINYDATGMLASSCVRPFPLVFAPIDNVLIDHFHNEGKCPIGGLTGANLISNVTIRDYYGVSNQATRWDNFTFNPSLLVQPGPGYIKNFLIENTHVTVPDLFDFSGGINADNLFSTSVENLTIRNYNRDSFFNGQATFAFVGTAAYTRTFKNVTIDGYTATNNTSNYPAHISVTRGAVFTTPLRVVNSSIFRNSTGYDRMIVLDSSTVPRVSLRDCYTNNAGAILKFDTTTEINYIDAVGITQDSMTEASFVRAADGIDMHLSGYSGTTPISGNGVWTKQRGDGFTDTMTGGVVSSGILFDDFNRANSSTTAGNLLTPVSAWNVTSGTWGIVSNLLYCVSETSSGSFVKELILAPDAGVADYTYSTDVVTLSSTSAPEIIFRYVDASNFWFLSISHNAVQLYKKVAGTNTAVGSIVVAMSNIGTVNFTIVTNGSSISVVRNGSNLDTIADTDLSTATFVGYQVVSGAGGLGGGVRFDNTHLY